MKKKFNIYYNGASHHEDNDVFNALMKALHSIDLDLDWEVERPGNKNSSSMEATIEYIKGADLIITNLSAHSDYILFEMGIASGFGIPNIIIADQEERISLDIRDYVIALYSHDNLDLLTNKLAKLLTDVLKEPKKFIGNIKDKNVRKIFVSYSHNDIKYLNRLKVHIKPLERNNYVELWSDTLIQSGDKWEKKIGTALNEASIAILLISADFIASDFIVNNELQPLLKNAEDKGTIILPVIVKPCRFLREPSISQFQSINNPAEPLCKLNEYEQEDIYELISQRIELALQDFK